MSKVKDGGEHAALRAALKEAGAPLLSAPDGFAAAVAASLRGGEGRVPAAAAALALAGAFAAAVALLPAPESPVRPPEGPSLTEKFVNPWGAAVPGAAAGSELLYSLSDRTYAGPGKGPVTADLKEGI